MIKSMPTEEFAKLPDVKLYSIKIEVLGMRSPLWFKSKNRGALIDQWQLAERLHGEGNVEIDLKEFEVKDTSEYCDENGVYCMLESIKGQWLEK